MKPNHNLLILLNVFQCTVLLFTTFLILSCSSVVERDFNLNEDVTITMVWIPAGSFIMGHLDNEQDSGEDEAPRHEVNIASGFWMGKYEVTQAQWGAVMENNLSHFDGENLPVERVSWDDIYGFLKQADDGFRLPSEAEWEYACRAGTDTRFYWGDDADDNEIGDYAWYYTNSNSKADEVGQKRPNAFGLYDISGNVWEWCEDDYHTDYIDAPADGSPWIESPRTNTRVLRGGAWDRKSRYCRSATRYWFSPLSSDNVYGFRLVRDEDN